VPFLYEFDLATGECRERQLDDRSAEFPRCDERRVGYENRWGYALVGEGRDILGPGGHRVLRYDRRGGHSVAHDFGPGHFPGEPVFVPRRPDADEGDGFVLVVVFDGESGRSYVAVLDAQHLADRPLARAHLRQRVPLGFHGNFAPGVV
jgi:carotenoid cleavage dioxygenase